MKKPSKIELVCPKYDIIKLSVDKMYDPESGEEIQEAHGGQGKMVVLPMGREVPEYSVLRRKLG